MLKLLSGVVVALVVFSTSAVANDKEGLKFFNTLPSGISDEMIQKQKNRIPDVKRHMARMSSGAQVKVIDIVAGSSHLWSTTPALLEIVLEEFEKRQSASVLTEILNDTERRRWTTNLGGNYRSTTILASNYRTLISIDTKISKYENLSRSGRSTGYHNAIESEIDFLKKQRSRAEAKIAILKKYGAL